MSYRISKSLEVPSLSTKSMAEGDSVLVEFDTEYTVEKNKEGNDMQVARVTLVETGEIRKLAMPFLVFRNWEAIKGNVVMLTKGVKSGACRLWQVDLMEEDNGGKTVDKGESKRKNK